MYAREVAIMRHQRGGVDRERGRGLNGVRQPEAERSAQPRGTFGDIDVQWHRLPCLKDGAVAARKRVVAGPERTGQHLGNRDRRYGEAETPGCVRIKQRLESRPEPGMTFEDIYDRWRIEKEQGLFGQIGEF